MIGASTPGKPPQPKPKRPKGRRRRGPPAARTPSTRVQILQSAAAAFRKLGYHGATVEQIATSLRMKKGNLYYYFRNKEEILFACHQYSLDRVIDLIDDIARSDEEPEVKLRRLIVAFVHTILDELHGTTLFIDLEALTPSHLKTIIVRRDRVDRGMRQIIVDGVAAGAFVPSDPKLISFAILGAVNWIPRWFKVGGPASSQEVADRFADFLIAGLRSG
jgi:TetR/AcrR family transcriptional regulator, cholesterol catabolism regulator